MRRVILRLMLAVAVLLPLGGASAFEFQQVIDKARERAAQPYQAPPTIARFMRELNYDQYQNIRFDAEKSLWRENDSRFQVMFFSAGLFYTHPVAINVIDAQGAHAVPYRKDYFSFADAELERRVPADLGFAGFKLAFPLKDAKEHNQFLVFAGASYFRGVGRDNAWGISGRGVAVDTGRPSGERFPSFVEFWLERPAPGADAMRFYGLLDGQDLTGAYRFTAYPGAVMQLKVEAVLFARDTAVELLGIAPLTSMFFYGENTARPLGEWRAEVHDSDGLLIHDGASGEWLWRPLLNPMNLQTDYFRAGNVRGFGLLQRDRLFASYHDLGARYDQRPSAWVAPQGDWGAGEVVLVQIPTDSETNDNIVAFWTPADKLVLGEPRSLAYTVSFGAAEVAQSPMGRAINTFVGDGGIVGGGSVDGAYRLIVDFAGGPLERLKGRAAVLGMVSMANGTNGADQGEVIEHFVEYNAALQSWRLSILARPARGQSLELRAYLREGDKTLTETWTYRLPAANDIRRTGSR